MVGSVELVVEALVARVVAREAGRASPAVVDSSAALRALVCKALGGGGADLVEHPAERRGELLDALREPCPALVAAAREVLASTRAR